LVSLGILVPVHSPVVASPLVIVTKSDGSPRVAVDYREVNDNLVIGSGGCMPNMKSLFHVFNNKKYFAVVDNLWGYHQLPVAEDCQWLLTITTPWGFFKFTRLPFGISPASGEYQERMISEVLPGIHLNGAVCFIDDTAIVGDSVDSFLHNLDNVLSRMEAKNVRLKPSKCRFGFEEAVFLGYKFNQHGFTMTDERKQGILNIPSPSTVKQLRGFIGMVNFMRDFIPDLSKIIEPLTDLTKKSKMFEWTERAEEAFQIVKNAVANVSTLFHIQDDGKLTLYTDASLSGVGAMLAQVQSDVERPIMFLSKKFSDAAKKWSTIEQECFAIFWAITQLTPYLLGHHFYVATDHRNLVYINGSEIPKLVRWRLRLMQFNFTIVHIPGETNVVADVLSRFNRMVVNMQGERYDTDDVLESVHNSFIGHHGFNRTMRLLRSYVDNLNVVWPECKADVKEFLKECPVCQKIKDKKKVALMDDAHQLHGDYPMYSLSADTVGPLPEDEDGNKFIVVIVDNFSKFCMLFSTKSTTALEFAKSFLEFVGIFGVPGEIRTDGGSQFTADVIADLISLLGVEHLVIVPYHPQANGIVERRNAEVMKHLRAIVMERRVKEKWSLYLPIVQRILNAAYDSSIDTYPAKIIFGEFLPIQRPLLFVHSNVDNMNDYLVELKNGIESAISASVQYYAERDKFSAINMGAYTPFDFKVGHYVMVRYPTRPPNKLNAKYRGPMVIVSQPHVDIFSVMDLATEKVINVHRERLIHWYSTDNETGRDRVEIAAADHDEFVVDSIVEHRGNPKKKAKMEFRVRWAGYDPEEDTWEPYREVKNLEAFDVYLVQHPELQF